MSYLDNNSYLDNPSCYTFELSDFTEVYISLSYEYRVKKPSI